MIKSPAAILTSLTLVVLLNVESNTVLSHYAGGISPIFPPRTESFLLDALSWMTLRENGVLMDRASLSKTWLPLLKEKFLSSPYYNTLVIAFELGVVPKLTLKENDACDSTHTLKHKYWYNQSTVERYVRDFIFDNYYSTINLKLPPAPKTPAALCDSRQGLICNPTSNKCECPEGSKMSPVTGSTGSRCMLDEDEICILVDTAAGNTNDPDNPFTKFLPHAIFYFEKPLGCKDGTQCRFKAGDLLSPHCYSSSGSPAWVDGQPEKIPYGEPCTVGLHWKRGMCSNDYDYENKYGGVTCYNYGLSPKNKTGICTYSYGVFGGIARRKGHKYKYGEPPNLFGLTFLTPRFIPLRGEKLAKYQAAAAEVFYLYFEKVQSRWNRLMGVGPPCLLEKSKRFEPLAKYYYELVKAPVQGSSFVTDEKELNDMLQEGQSLMTDAETTTKLICQIAWDTKHCEPYPIGQNWGGNDGECKKTSDLTPEFPATKALERDFGKNWQEFIKIRDSTEEFIADLRIARHNEVECTPAGGGGTQCPKGYICYEDYNDYQEDQVYEDNTCNIQPGKKLKQTCHEEGRYAWQYFGSCEVEIMTKRVIARLNIIFQNGYRHLGMGDACNYDVDSYVWGALMYPARVNGYHFITTDFGGHKADTDGFCDRSKLLECKKDNTCGCIDNAEPRVSNDKQYKSDYCYLNDESCRPDLDKLVFLGIDDDKAETLRHYGDPATIAGEPDVTDTDAEPACSNGNMCVFIDSKNVKCTASNTGKTGFEAIPPSTTESTGPGFNPSTPAATGMPGKKPVKMPLKPPTKYSRGTRSRTSADIIVIWSMLVGKLMLKWPRT